MHRAHWWQFESMIRAEVRLVKHLKLLEVCINVNHHKQDSPCFPGGCLFPTIVRSSQSFKTLKESRFHEHHNIIVTMYVLSAEATYSLEAIT